MVERSKVASPFLRSGCDVRGMMLRVLVCVTLSAAYFGFRYDSGFLWRYAAYVAAGLLVEVVYTLLRDGRFGAPRWSSAVTAALLVLSVPARMPWPQVLGGIVVSVVFGKLMVDRDALRLNPMLVGRLFLMVAFPDAIQDWETSAGRFDAISSATPLGLLAGTKAVYDPVRILTGDIGGTWEGVYAILPGSPGEVFPLLAIVCGVWLYLSGVLDWRPGVAFLAAFAVTCLLLGMPVGFHIAAGSAIFCAVYIITDPRSTPGSKFGRYAAGVIAGAVTAAVRNHGYYSEGVMFGVLAANIVSPTLDRIAFHARGAMLARRRRALARS